MELEGVLAPEQAERHIAIKIDKTDKDFFIKFLL